jgi:hypothetical protein
MDMERFSHLLWANLTSCHFSFFLNFTPLYIFLIYGVFFNKALQDFDEYDALDEMMQNYHTCNNSTNKLCCETYL